MKTSKILVAMFFVAVTMAFAACNDKEDNPEPQPVAIDLTGSAWEGNLTSTFLYMGIDMNVEIFHSIDFTSKTQGLMFTEFSVDVPMLPGVSYSDTTSDAFTYVFSNNTLTITDSDGVAETLTYNPADSTFTMPVPDEVDEEMGMSYQEMLGTDKIVFRKVR